jgi:hypothetical protein
MKNNNYATNERQATVVPPSLNIVTTSPVLFTLDSYEV